MSTLILSGWTQDAGALNTLDTSPLHFDYSEHPSPEASFAGLARFAQVPHIIGWSLGGQLALRAIAAGVLAPRHLTLIAAPCRFVGEQGMGHETFTLFRASYAADAARTTTRFNALTAKGDGDAKKVMQRLVPHPATRDARRWLPWLDDLGHYDLHHADLAKAPPTLIIHGMNDAIVPFAQTAMLAELLPVATVHGWADVGHAPHAHDAARLRDSIQAHRALHGVA